MISINVGARIRPPKYKSVEKPLLTVPGLSGVGGANMKPPSWCDRPPPCELLATFGAVKRTDLRFPPNVCVQGSRVNPLTPGLRLALDHCRPPGPGFLFS